MSVLTHLNNTAHKLILSTQEETSIRTSINYLKSNLNSYFVSLMATHLQFGSSTRGTMLPRIGDPESDVDYMVIFNNSNNYKPQTYIEWLKKFVEAKYSRSQVYRDHPTIVLELNHIKFELVPAYHVSNFFSDITYIPAPRSGYSEWISTNPNEFNNQLTNKNVENSYIIKPLVRLVKYWNAINDYVYPSYELEQELVNKVYWFCRNLKDYFYDVINGFSTWGFSQTKTNAVNRAKSIIENTKNHESNNRELDAEKEIKRLIPTLY